MDPPIENRKNRLITFSTEDVVQNFLEVLKNTKEYMIFMDMKLTYKYPYTDRRTEDLRGMVFEIVEHNSLLSLTGISKSDIRSLVMESAIELRNGCKQEKNSIINVSLIYYDNEEQCFHDKSGHLGTLIKDTNMFFITTIMGSPNFKYRYFTAQELQEAIYECHKFHGAGEKNTSVLVNHEKDTSVLVDSLICLVTRMHRTNTTKMFIKIKNLNIIE